MTPRGNAQGDRGGGGPVWRRAAVPEVDEPPRYRGPQLRQIAVQHDLAVFDDDGVLVRPAPAQLA